MLDDKGMVAEGEEEYENLILKKILGLDISQFLQQLTRQPDSSWPQTSALDLNSKSGNERPECPHEGSDWCICSVNVITLGAIII